MIDRETSRDSADHRKISHTIPAINGSLPGMSTCFSSAANRRRTLPSGTELIHQGPAGRFSYLLLSGWACSFKPFRDGQRQIIDFHVPGDFLGLSNLLLDYSDRCIQAITQIEVVEISMTAFTAGYKANPQLASELLEAACLENMISVKHICNMSNYNAGQHVAHLLLELGSRLSLVGLGSRAGFTCPLSQDLLADALGLSAVHVNRIFRSLREMDLVTFRNGLIKFKNYDLMVEFADFDPSYLHVPRPPM